VTASEALAQHLAVGEMRIPRSEDRTPGVTKTVLARSDPHQAAVAMSSSLTHRATSGG
jgi:hypothetical protein